MNVSGSARVAGVIGWPVSHSRSPRLHGYWLRQYEIDGAYVPLPVRPEHLAEAVGALPLLGFAGANVTVPHKEAVLPLMDELDGQARRIGAVNTIVVRPDGSMLGRNTDGYGFIENLRQGAPDWRPARGPAVVLGAGGAARAVCAALLDAGVLEIVLLNRTTARAEALAAEIGGAIRVRPWAERAGSVAGAGLLVNTTTLGMRDAAPLDLDLSALPREALVTDIVYQPLETDLLRRARQRGNVVVDGLGMLLHQGRPGFAAWFGVEPEVTEALRAFVQAD